MIYLVYCISSRSHDRYDCSLINPAVQDIPRYAVQNVKVNVRGGCYRRAVDIISVKTEVLTRFFYRMADG